MQWMERPTFEKSLFNHKLNGASYLSSQHQYNTCNGALSQEHAQEQCYQTNQRQFGPECVLCLSPSLPQATEWTPAQLTRVQSGAQVRIWGLEKQIVRANEHTVAQARPVQCTAFSLRPRNRTCVQQGCENKQKPQMHTRCILRECR